MKFLGIFGLVGTLCTFAIIAYMWGQSADSLTPHVNNLNTNARNNGGSNSGSSDLPLPKPYGSEITLRNIGIALTNHRTTHGDFPKAHHLAAQGKSAQSSNDILRMLFQGSGIAEKSFNFQGSFISTHKADGVTTGSNALAPGENHWAYIQGPRNIDQYTNVPVLIEPYRPGESSYRQSDYGKGRGVLVLFSDGSVKTVKINSKGEPVIRKKNILSAEFNGWKGDTPTIYQPAR